MSDRTRREFLREMGTAALLASAGSGLAAAAGLGTAHAEAGEKPAAGGASPELTVHSVNREIDRLTAYVPLPSLGLVPVHAFLLRSAEPVLVDTNLAQVSDAFMTKLRSMIDLNDLRWIWLTHTDADHTGSLRQVLAEAPNARVVTTFLGMGKMNLQGHPVDRTYLLNPGQSLDVGDRQLVAFKPPTFDAPETTGFFETKTKVLFSADSFGALMQRPAETAEEIPAAELREGLVRWATVDAPWLQIVDGDRFGARLAGVRELEPSMLLSSHLPPATGMTETLIGYLDQARSAPGFVGPDQAALEEMLSAK